MHKTICSAEAACTHSIFKPHHKPLCEVSQAYIMCGSQLPSEVQCALVEDDRVERQRVVMQQLAGMRHSASSLQERVAKLSGDVHPRMLGQVHEPPTLLLPVAKCHTVQPASVQCALSVCHQIHKEESLDPAGT